MSDTSFCGHKGSSGCRTNFTFRCACRTPTPGDAECEPCRVIREPLISAPGAPEGRLNTLVLWLCGALMILQGLGMMTFVLWCVIVSVRLFIGITFTNVRQFVINAEIAAGRDPVIGAVIADRVGWVIAAMIPAVAGFAVIKAIASMVEPVVPAATATVPVSSPLNNRRQSRYLQRAGASRVRTPTPSSPSEVPRFQRVRQPMRPANLSPAFLRYPISPEQQPAVELPQPVVELPQPAPPPAADPVVPSPVTLNQLAENASILLELFSQGSHDNDIVSDEHHTIITNATAGVLTINARLRQANQRAGPREEMIPEPDCIICFAECADTLFMPCKHMVVCTPCSVIMGLAAQGTGRVSVRCPACRTGVMDFVKVFRS